MPTRPTPGKKLVIACPPECSYHPDKIGEGKAELLKILRENGAGGRVFARRGAEILGRPLPSTNVQRHLHHYRDAEPESEPSPDQPEKVTDLEILDSIITAGFRNSRNWRPSIKDTLDAMKLKLQLTGNSAFENMLDAMAAASAADDDEEEGEVEEAPEAVLSPDERPVEDDE